MPKRLRSQKQREAINNIKNSFVNKLTPSQIDNYIDNNITDLSSAKEAMKKISKLLLYILKHINLQ